MSSPGLARRATVGRVLVVDDNEDAADLMCELLDALGFAARAAYDGHAALETSTSFRPSICLVDLDLPKMDGCELAVRLRAALPAPIKLVAITGYGGEQDRVRTKQAGFDAHLLKPVDLDALISFLNE